MSSPAPITPKKLRPLVDKLYAKFSKEQKKGIKELKNLVKSFNKKADFCELKLEQLVKGIATPKAYTEADWNRWKGFHKGKWIKGKPAKGSPDNARWSKAKSKEKQVIQPVEWLSSKRPFGYNITYKDGRVGGLDPKPGAKHMWEHLGLPFDLGECCKFILWVVWKDAKKTELTYFLEGIDCQGNKVSVTFDTVGWGYGRWKVKR